MVGEEGTGLGGRGLKSGGCVAQAPTGCLHGPEEVLTIGVVFNASHHTGPQGRIQASGVGPPGGIAPRTFPMGGDHHFGMGNHRISSHALRLCDPGTKPDYPGKWMTSCVVTRHFFAALQGHVKFHYGDNTPPIYGWPRINMD